MKEKESEDLIIVVPLLYMIAALTKTTGYT